MGFVKHALIGIALYEAVKYVLKRREWGFECAGAGNQADPANRQQLRREEVDVIGGARQTDQLDQMKENAGPGGNSSNSSGGLAGQPDVTHLNSGDELVGGTDPEAPLTGKEPDKDDPWKKSLANDDLRAPDS